MRSATKEKSRRSLRSPAACSLVGLAENTGLPDAAATVVYVEAMLSGLNWDTLNARFGHVGHAK